MADLPILGYKRHSMPTLVGKTQEETAAGLRRYYSDELQRIETSLITQKEGIDLTFATGTLTAGDLESIEATLTQAIDDLNAIVAAQGTAITNEQIIREDADSALASDITAVTATANGNTAGIITEQTARIDGDNAEATARGILGVTVGENTAAIIVEQTARADADSALASDITLLGVTVGDNTALVATEALARADADTALASDITVVSASVTTEANTRAGADTALSGDITTVSASVTSEATARADADLALASDITTVEASAGDNAAAIITEASARAAADGALTTSVNGAIASAATAQATADGKIVTFYQASAPVGASIGDLWFDTDDGNKIYRYSGSAWVAAPDADIATAISTAAGAQATADGKVTTFYQAAAPTAEGTGDLWVDTDDGNTLYRWSGAAWVLAQDTAIPALLAKYGVKLNVNGYITGFEQLNDGTTGSFKIHADEFLIIDPAGGAGQGGVEIFEVSGGYVTMKNIRSAATGARLQIETDVLTVYDSSNVLRVKLGNLA